MVTLNTGHVIVKVTSVIVKEFFSDWGRQWVSRAVASSDRVKDQAGFCDWVSGSPEGPTDLYRERPVVHGVQRYCASAFLLTLVTVDNRDSFVKWPYWDLIEGGKTLLFVSLFNMNFEIFYHSPPFNICCCSSVSVQSEIHFTCQHWSSSPSSC